MASSRISVCLLCWLETKRVSRGDVCLCKGTIMMLASMRRQQLMAEHREDRAVPLGIPGALANMWNDTEALDNFLSPTPPGLGAAPRADVPHLVVEARARLVDDFLNLSFDEPAAAPPPGLEVAPPPANAQPQPEAPAPDARDLLNLFPADVQRWPLGAEFWRGWYAAETADGVARPAADAALPAEATLDELEALRARCADLEEEKEVMRRRCEDLESRVEALESRAEEDEPWQYFENDFAERLQDIAERLRALERPWEQWR